MLFYSILIRTRSLTTILKTGAHAHIQTRASSWGRSLSEPPGVLASFSGAALTLRGRSVAALWINSGRVTAGAMKAGL